MTPEMTPNTEQAPGTARKAPGVPLLPLLHATCALCTPPPGKPGDVAICGTKVRFSCDRPIGGEHRMTVCVVCTDLYPHHQRTHGRD